MLFTVLLETLTSRPCSQNKLCSGLFQME